MSNVASISIWDNGNGAVITTLDNTVKQVSVAEGKAAVEAEGFTTSKSRFGITVWSA